MNCSKYLLIGGGMTADAAARGIRQIDSDGSIGLISMEPDPPYSRPPLTKGLWKGKPFDSIWRGTEEQNVAMHLGHKVLSLDAKELVVKDDRGIEYHGDKILLATGGKARRLPSGAENVMTYRSLADYRKLSGIAKEGREFAVVGGGFIGAEIAAALTMKGAKVTMLFPESGIGARILPNEVSQYLNSYYRSKGVVVLPGEEVTGVFLERGKRVIHTKHAHEIIVDEVVSGLGIELNTELARSAGLTVDNGIIVDETLRAGHPDIFAAGDVAEFFNPALGKRMRVEHEDNALSMGLQAGRNMAGANEAYTHLPYFYSDLFDLGYEAVGELDPRLVTFADWAEPNKKGIVYYFKDDRVRGVLLWNVWKKVPAARELIAQSGSFKPADLKANPSPGWKITF